MMRWTDLLLGLFAFALRSTVLLVAAWIATSLLRRASAATRHLIWTGAIAGVLALPLFGVLLPNWNVPVISIAAKTDSPITPVATPSGDRDRTAPAIASMTTENAKVETAPVIAPAPTSSVPAPSTSLVSGAIQSIGQYIPLRGIVTVFWLTLAILLLARIAMANARISAWQRSSRPVDDGRWLGLLHKLARRFGIERPVVLLANDDTDVPVTWGIVYPVILVPTHADKWDEEQRVAVLTHELAHVKRFDALTQLLGQLALALLWFHPLVWLAVRRMRLEREHACDDFVLVTGARASRYADDLLGLARQLKRPTAPAAAALAMARRSEIEGRLLAILDPAVKRTAVRRARVALLTAGVILLAAPLAAFRPGARIVPLPLADEAKIATAKPNVPVPATAAPRLADSAVRETSDALAVPTFSALAHKLDLMSSATLEMRAKIPALSRIPTDTEPLKPIDLQTLIEVTKAAKPMTSDHEKGELLRLIAKRWVRSDALRDAYIDAVSTMTSDDERAKALIALLERDSLPAGSTAAVLRAAAAMTSDASKGQVLKLISPQTFGDSTVQRAYLDALVAMTSDAERGAALAVLIRQRPLAPDVQSAILRATGPMTSDQEKANTLVVFLEKHGVADSVVRRSFLNAARTLTSDAEYRRVMTALMK